jgi:hypothetical protein
MVVISLNLHNKEIIKIRSRQHEHGGAVNSCFPFIDGVSTPPRQGDPLGEVLFHKTFTIFLVYR